MSHGNATVIDGKVYCGGGRTGEGRISGDDDDRYSVYRYDPTKGSWTSLPQLPMKFFGLGVVNEKLVAVGGKKKDGGLTKRTNEVYTFHKRSNRWKQSIPPMPTARDSPGVLSLETALIVAGGDETMGISKLDVVEIFQADTSQWYTTDPLPTPCYNISLALIGNTCYTLGGYMSSYLSQALYASVDELLQNAVPANQTTRSGSSDTQSAWKTLPDTPTYGPNAAVLSNNLFAIGGKASSIGEADKKKVHMYSPSTNSWIYISDLPAPRSRAAVAAISATEFVVIGGWDHHGRVDTVYKGTLCLN